MLAVSSLRSIKDDQNQSQMEAFSMEPDDFMDFSDGNILDGIHFDDIFVGIDDEHVLPDLEMDPEILAEFSISYGGEESERTSSPSVEKSDVYTARKNTLTSAGAAAAGDKEDEEKQSSSSASDTGTNSGSSRGEETTRKRDESALVNPSSKETDKAKKSSAHSKNSQGKRKVKVDWTPELHRRFVQAVEQLGVDKAVPSRILEIMGIDCLTRHNIASHLQKYRSHRKHLLAREAEAASWSQRRQMYGVAAVPPANGGKRDASPWLAPTIGFPPMSHMHHFRPLHVWGHPTMDQSLMHMWPKHVSHTPSPPPPPPPPLTVNPTPAWTPKPLATTPTPADPSFWHVHHQRVPNPTTVTPVTPCFPQPFSTTRFASPPVPVPVPVPGFPHHHAMFKVNQGIGFPTGQSGLRSLFDFHPSKESIDAALGDILSKPWLPLPLGLKPPALESVMGELQRQGVPKIPPFSS